MVKRPLKHVRLGSPHNTAQKQRAGEIIKRIVDMGDASTHQSQDNTRELGFRVGLKIHE